MRNVLELDLYSNIITDLGFDSENMYKEADVQANIELAEELMRGKLDYYRQLMEEKEPVLARFTGFRRGNKSRSDELFVIFEDIELVYPVERVMFEGVPDATALLEKEYKVYICKVDEEEKRVTLSDLKVHSRRQAVELINRKLDDGEEIYLRGNILGLQKNAGKRETQMAAYVNIQGLGIIGVVPIKQWSVGYTVTEVFREEVERNKNAIINFRVYGTTKIRYGRRERIAFTCSRKDYLEKMDYDPWKLVGKKLDLHSTVKVLIVSPGKSKDSFFGAIDGISDFNALCFISNNSGLEISSVVPGRYYYGYVQKVDIDGKYFRVRLTGPAEHGSDIKKSGIQGAKEE